MTIANLSFETQGPNPGDAALWTRSVSVPFIFEAFETPLFESRFEGFERGWGVDDFVDSLIVPTNAAAMDFGTEPSGGVITPYDGFERGWRLPNSHGLAMSGPGPYFGAAPPFNGYPYGLRAPFALFNGATLNFTITDADGEATVVACVFSTGQFVDITHALATEVVHAINVAIGTAYAGSPAAGFAFYDAFGHVFIRTVETGGATVQEGGATGITAAVVSKVGSVVTLDGFPNLNDSFVGLPVAFTGASSPGNNVTTPIVSVTYTGPGQWSMTISNAGGVAPDANNGSIDWTIAPTIPSSGCAIFVNGSSTSLAALGWEPGNYAGGVDAQHPGDETAIFIFDSAVQALFSAVEFPPHGIAYDGFEAGWPVAQIPFYLAWSAVPAATALFDSGSVAYENFSAGWDNVPYHTVMPATTTMLFPGQSFPTQPYENFFDYFPDETVAPDFTTSKINDVGTSHVNGDAVTIYAGVTPQGNAGLVPSGLNPLITYYVVSATANSFKLSLTSGGPAVAFTDNGTAPCFIKADPTQYWTLTNVGI
jgi:hypothetical protein